MDEDNNIIKSGNNILRQKIKDMMERAKTYGLVTEPRPNFYRKTKLFEKYLEDGEKYCIDDKIMLKFIMDNHELFLEVVGENIEQYFFG